MTDIWGSTTRRHVRFLQDQLIATTKLADANQATDEMREWLMAPIREMIETVYERDMPLAKLADQSDLLLHIRGPAASGPNPRVSLLTRMLTVTRETVTKMMKQFAGIETLRMPPELDMGLVGLARGSLFIGFSANESTDGANLSQQAIQSIQVASVLVEKDADLEHVMEAFPDPGVRDMSVAAIQSLSPSGRGGVKEIDLYARNMAHPVALTTNTRTAARRLLNSRPEPQTDEAAFIGTVREIDLDASRFELRNLDGYVGDVRCAHAMTEDEVKPLMDHRIRVTGFPEFGTGGKLRLLWVTNVEIVE